MAELTINYNTNMANAFLQDVRDTRNSYYVFAGRSLPWPNESSPPPANGSVEQIGLSVYKDLLFGKLLSNNDVYPLIPRYDWTSNTVYAQYDQDDADLYSKQFYVMNDQFEVYKCISNNRGAKSTIEPRLNASTGTFQTADGYTWKYMFTVDSQANTKFTTANYIPVDTNANVSGNTVSGTIDAYAITNGGNNYQIYETGFVYSLINKTTLQLPSTSSPNNNHYTRSSIYLKSGFGAGQIREITGYNGGTKQITVANSFDTFTRLDFTGIPQGTVATGYYLEQSYDIVNFLYLSNNQAFTVGSNVVQSDTGAHGTVLSANSSTLRISRASSALFDGSNSLPVRDLSNDGTARTGTVSVVTGSNSVTGSSTQFTNATTGYTVGSYIRVGSDANNQIRRITSIANNTLLTVASNFTNTLNSNVHFFVPIAAEPYDIVSNQGGFGVISNTNLSSLRLTVNNSVLPGVSFTVGESVNQVTSANVVAGANAIIAFANSSTLFLSAVEGPWVANLFILGSSSQQRSQIVSIDSNPNVTIRDPGGNFVLGFPVNFKVNQLSTSYSGNATVIATTTLPNDQTEYLIAPTVTISGDGTGAAAIAIVNTTFGSANNVIGIEVVRPGSNYTFANVSIYANSSYGSGATARAIIAPVGGHGKDAIQELGGRYVGVTSLFDIGTNEGFFYPTYGSYRRIGILENPEFADVTVTLREFDRVNLSINNRVTSSSNVSITSWFPGEVVVQSTTNAAGVVVSGNNTALQLKNVLGTFTASNTQIRGYYSNTTANVASQDVIRFQVTTDSLSEVVSQVGSGARGEITQLLSNTEVVMSNVVGKFAAGDTMFESSVNAYAVVNTIATANGSRDVTTSFGNKFNQTARITLTSNTGSFANNETVIQAITNAYGVVVSDRNELDLAVTVTTGTFTTGQKVTSNNTGATGYILSANNTYLKLTGVVPTGGGFVTGDTINSGSSRLATIGAVYPALLLNNVDGPNRFQANNTDNQIEGQTSGASGICNSYALIQYPELVRDTGRVIYTDNIQPVTRSDISKEEVRLVIKF
jgi:hypothetical protein